MKTIVACALLSVILCMIVPPQQAQAAVSFVCNNDTITPEQNLYSPPATCTNEDIEECTMFYKVCWSSEGDDNCNDRVVNCTRSYVECMNAAVAASTVPLANCSSWSQELQVAITSVVAGSSYDGSQLQSSCHNTLCKNYIACTGGNVTGWNPHDVCVAPTSDTPQPSLLPTSTPVPAGTVYHFTATFASGNISGSLLALAARLGIEYSDIVIVSLQGEETTFHFKGNSAGLASQQMLGIMDNKQELAQLGITKLNAAAFDSPTLAPTPAPSDEDDPLTTELVILIVVCTIAGIVTVGGGIAYAMKRKKDAAAAASKKADTAVAKATNAGVDDPFMNLDTPTPAQQMTQVATPALALPSPVVTAASVQPPTSQYTPMPPLPPAEAPVFNPVATPFDVNRPETPDPFDAVVASNQQQQYNPQGVNDAQQFAYRHQPQQHQPQPMAGEFYLRRDAILDDLL